MAYPLPKFEPMLNYCLTDEYEETSKDFLFKIKTCAFSNVIYKIFNILCIPENTQLCSYILIVD